MDMRESITEALDAAFTHMLRVDNLSGQIQAVTDMVLFYYRHEEQGKINQTLVQGLMNVQGCIERLKAENDKALDLLHTVEGLDSPDALEGWANANAGI